MTTKLAQFIDADPKVSAWVTRMARKSHETARVFASGLFTYWTQHLASDYKTLVEYEKVVSAQAEDKENEVRITWARNLEDFLLTYVPKTTNRPLSRSARRVIFVAVKSFLESRLARPSFNT